MYSCFFIGHRDAPSTLQQKLDETVDYLWRRCGVTEFIVGHHGNFDSMAASAVETAWKGVISPAPASVFRKILPMVFFMA